MLRKRPTMENLPIIVAENIIEFICDEIMRDFPEINGVGMGYPLEECFDYLDFPEKEKLDAISAKVAIIIHLETALAESQQQEIRRRIAEKIIKFEVRGKARLLKGGNDGRR